jgi:hypothetical protein
MFAEAFCHCCYNACLQELLGEADELAATKKPPGEAPRHPPACICAACTSKRTAAARKAAEAAAAGGGEDAAAAAGGVEGAADAGTALPDPAAAGAEEVEAEGAGEGMGVDEAAAGAQGEDAAAAAGGQSKKAADKSKTGLTVVTAQRLKERLELVALLKSGLQQLPGWEADRSLSGRLSKDMPPAWTPALDLGLVQGALKHGIGNWAAIMQVRGFPGWSEEARDHGVEV